MGYLVFARREYQDPLEWIGGLKEELAGEDHSVESVRRQALERFGDAGWIEMVAVPELELVRVIPLESAA